MALFFKTQGEKRKKIVDLLEEGEKHLKTNLHYVDKCLRRVRDLYTPYREAYGVDRNISFNIGRITEEYARRMVKSD